MIFLEILAILSAFLFPAEVSCEPKIVEVVEIIEVEAEPEIIYMHPFGTKEDPYREDLHGDIGCSCVRTARSLGINIPYGMDAVDLKPNTDKPEVGIGVLIKTENGHIAKITKIEEDKLWVIEGGYSDCEIVERFYSFDDPRIIGYYK